MFITRVSAFSDYQYRNSRIQAGNFSSVYCRPAINFGENRGILPLNDKEKTELLRRLNEMSGEKNKAMSGSLGSVYRIDLPERPALAVKEYKNIYAGRNPSQEKENLKQLPKDCSRVQKFVDLIEHHGQKYLITTFQKGQSLAHLKDSMSDKLIANILEELFKIERNGLAFYDYSMANIVFTGDEPRFFDFEVSKKQSLKNINHESDLCHLSRNTYFPFITNLAGFEIRTIGKIIGELEKYPDGEERSLRFTERYLKQASKFYKKTEELYREKSLEAGSEMPAEAVNYSGILARLFAAPSKEVVSIEKQSMRIKELLTEYWFRNDPDLEHDDKLYSNIPEYIKNLKNRFLLVQAELASLSSKAENMDVKKYCQTTSELLKKIATKEINYLSSINKL